MMRAGMAARLRSRGARTPRGGPPPIGARRLLVAFNVNLDTGDLDVARRIARAVRASDGGLDAVKAIGVRTESPKVVQVSMNLVDFERTPLHEAFEAVRREAERLGVEVRNSEVVGLVPGAALLPAAARALRLGGFTLSQVLDRRLLTREPPPAPPDAPEG